MARNGVNLAVKLGPVNLAGPLVAASGTVGSVVDFLGVTNFRNYGAAVAKSVSREPWEGRPAPRISAAGAGMLNGIGIQNPGIDAWAAAVGPLVKQVPTRFWGSAVGRDADEFAEVAVGLVGAGVDAVEVNLSCPNLDDGRMFALDPIKSGQVIAAVRGAVSVPIGAKLSPNSESITAVASATADAGADWVVVGNTVLGARIDLRTRKPAISGVIGGYSGSPIKPIALRCVIEIHRAVPDLPILGCGGVRTGDDVVEYVLAGASAVALGTIHFAEPRAGRRILREIRRRLTRMGESDLSQLVGGAVS